MKQKWNSSDEIREDNRGNPVPKKLTLFATDEYRPKLLLKKAPSMRVIKNYNNIATDGDDNVGADNYTFKWDLKDPEDDEVMGGRNNNIAMNTADGNFPMAGHIYTTQDSYDYTTMESKGSRVSSDVEVRKEDAGSTAKLVRPRIRKSCHACISFLEILLCTISLAAGLGNLYRLPQSVVSHGGIPFFVAYLVLVILIGLPLLFLEMGIGQIVQDGFTRTWKAVPFFKGIGYVKLAAGFLLAIYYPLYMGLSLYYLIWFAKDAPPFAECAVVKMSQDGYTAEGIPGQECIKKTFLVSPFEDPIWFGLFAGLLLLIWCIVMAWCIKRTKTYEKALIVFLLCTLVCLIALVVKAIDTNLVKGLTDAAEGADWSKLGTGEVWYYAAIQMFFSTNIGFGVFTTNAGVIYKKSNPFRTSLVYVFINLIMGLLSICLFYIVSENVDPTPKPGYIYEIHLLTHIYDVMLEAKDTDMQIWPLVVYMTILFAGFISMITIVYTIIKALSLETKNKLRWWQFSLILSFISFILGCAILLYPDLAIMHILDHYVVGNVVLITVILEVFSFMVFYGPKRLQSDLEFILGNTLSKLWICLWYFAPVALLAIVIWGLVTLPLTGQNGEDMVWMYATGWAIVVSVFIVILVIGMYVVGEQDEYYGAVDKLKSSFKPARNWGPSDPMMLHSWKQWGSKAEEGERDFTLKRRGTKDYAHSVKNRNKYVNKSHTPTVSDASTLSGTLTFKRGDQLANYNEPYYLRNTNEKPLRVTSLVDAMDSTPTNTFPRPHTHSGFKTNYNPLAYLNNINALNEVLVNDGSTSEGYGTYRKGPYLIEDEHLQHVCHRRDSAHEEATEL